MTLELRPFGITCNIQCQYCYQHPQRDSGNIRRQYDLEQMKAAAVEVGGNFTLFGGEIWRHCGRGDTNDTAVTVYKPTAT